jgi:pimeloyl-ACP methyl ester carboxylesterase
VLWWRGVRRETWHAAGFEVELYRHGKSDAEPWLLLHGMGSTSLSWGRTLGALCCDCRVWVPELSALGGRLFNDERGELTVSYFGSDRCLLVTRNSRAQGVLHSGNSAPPPSELARIARVQLFERHLAANLRRRHS